MCQDILKLKEERQKGIDQNTLECIRKMIRNLGLTAKKAMDVLEIPEEKQSKFRRLIHPKEELDVLFEAIETA